MCGPGHSIRCGFVDRQGHALLTAHLVAVRNPNGTDNQGSQLPSYTYDMAGVSM